MAKKSNNKCAIFSAAIKTMNGEQPAIVIVAVPNGAKAWQHAVVSTTVENDIKNLILHQESSLGVITTMDVIQEIFPDYRWSSRPADLIGRANIVVDQKIDGALATTLNIEPIKLSESDYSNSGSTLEVYIKNNFTVNDTVKDMGAAANKRKLAFPRDDIDYSLTFASSALTDEEKQIIAPPLDIEIAMSNSGRDCRKILYKILTTKYFTKNFTCIGLHGNPGGGKTKMVLNDICALHHIPVVAISCDPLMSVPQILSQVGPVNSAPIVDESTAQELIQTLKNRLTLLEQMSQRTDKEEEELREIISALSKLASVSKKCADLVKTPSILMKCLKNNLPLVVFLDEANCASTQFQNSLAPIISDGIFKDGPEVGRNSGTIKWVFAWNPNTSNTKSFDGKIFDRMSFIQVEDVADDVKLGYRLRKTIHGMYDTCPDYSQAATVLNKARAKYPESKDVIDGIENEVHSVNASAAALEWYAQKLVQERVAPQAPTFKTGVFNAAYLNEVQLDTQDKAALAVYSIDDLVGEINNELYAETCGKDTKNLDRNSFLYISDRNLDIFTDMIFSYSSVSKATYRYIFDLVPGGNTMRSASTAKSLNDKTPSLIAQAICDKLDDSISKLHNFLFVEITDSDVREAEAKMAGAVFDANAWVIPTALPVDADDTVPTATASTTDALDELNSLMG